MPPSRDPYELLDVDRSADLRAVKRAYRRLAKRYHPDAARDDGRRFVALRVAFETLADPERRAEWDRRHPAGSRARPVSGTSPRRSGNGRARPAAGSANGRTARPRDPLGRFIRADAAPWWEEIRGGRSVGGDLPGSRGDPHLGPSSSGAAWSSAARAYFRRLTRQESGAALHRAAPEGAPSRRR